MPPSPSPPPVFPHLQPHQLPIYVRTLLESPAALLYDRTPAERLVLLALAAFTCPDGTCFARVSRIAYWTGLTAYMVRRATRRLAQVGLLDVVATNGGPNIYAVRVNSSARRR